MKNNKSPAKQADLAVAAKAASSDPFPDVALMAGPVGCIAIMLGLSTFVNFLYFSCSQHQCSEIDGFNALRALPLVDALKLLFPAPTYLGAVIFFGWFISQYALHILLPGQYFTGWPTAPVGQRYVYKVNGLSSYVLTLAVFAGCVYYGVLDRSKMQIFMREFGAVLSVAQLFAYSIAILLYTKGVVFKQGLPHGNLFVDFFHGYEPNPRFFNIVVSDLKWYLEGRALSGWGIVALLLAYQQYLLSGELTASMVLVVLFHQIYIFHYFFNETYVLGMIDFTVEHMGWGLTWGNTVLLPFGYTMPEWTALAAPRTLTPLTIAVMLVVFFLGYYIFGVANEQRRKFRADPSAPIAGQTPRVVRTSKGRDLLVSGLWAYSRKPNYFGDLIVAWALGLPCMALNIAPFTNAIFLTILLIQRERRDNDWCILKYGKEDWDKYCRVVPYRIVPYVY